MDLHLQESVLVLLIQFSFYKKILNMTLDWDSKEGNIPKDSCTAELDSPRITLSSTDRTATNDITEVSMLILRQKNRLSRKVVVDWGYGLLPLSNTCIEHFSQGEISRRYTYPHVLIFNIATIRPLIDLDPEDIDLVFLYHITYIKLCSIATTLTVPNHFAVDPDMVGTVHSLESKTVENIIVPMIRDREMCLVQSCRVLRWNKWRVRRKRVANVSVVWMTIALELPVTCSVSDQDSVEARQFVRLSQCTNDLTAPFVHDSNAHTNSMICTMRQKTWLIYW